MTKPATRRPTTALITGASGGIGHELAKLFARDGHDLVLVARKADRLDRAADELRRRFAVAVRTIAKDLVVPESPDEIFSELADAGVAIDVLVNNAGFGRYGRFAESDLEAARGMMQVNMAAPVHLTRLFLPGMVARRRGNVLNVASLAGYQPGGPKMAVYFATKAFVLSFTRALSVELRGSGVHATALCPGPTRTAFHQADDTGRTLLYAGMLASPAKVARRGYRAMRWHRTAFVPGLVAKLLAFGGELPPRRIALEINNLLLMRV